MRRYEFYKYSNVGWIGEIPKSWKVNRLKFLSDIIPSNVDKKSYEGEKEILLCNYVDVYKNDKIDHSIDFMQATASDGQIQKLLLQYDDVIATKDSEDPADIGVPTYVTQSFENVVCGYHLTLLRTYKEILNGNFLFWILSSKNCSQHFYTEARGVTRYAIGSNAFKNLLLPLPTLKEQKAIANYLDNKTSEIESLIAKKKQLIKLLQEESTAIINQAVTKGIDLSVKLKDSGVEWIGEIPEHWGVKKLKYLLKETKDSLKSGPFGSHIKSSDYVENSDFKVYTQRNVLDKDFDNGTENIDESKFKELKGFLIHEKDILITTRGSIGKCSEFPADKPRGVLHPCLIRMQIDENKTLNSWIINYINNTSLFFSNVKYNSNSTIIDVIYSYTLKEIFFPVPPLNEQKIIMNWLQTKVEDINDIIFKTEKEIELMQEYKTALISEVVTGKVDVREEVVN